MRDFNGDYTGALLERIAFPLGGIGAGMICIEGAGKLSSFSIRHEPNVFNEPMVFSALHIAGWDNSTRVIEGPVAGWKTFFPWSTTLEGSSGNGGPGKDYGLPRFENARFVARFPFGTVRLTDNALPVAVEVTGWSPFIPGDSYHSSLPVACVDYRYTNIAGEALDIVHSFHARNFLGRDGKDCNVERIQDGFRFFGVNDQTGDRVEWFGASFPRKAPCVNCRWFRGAWYDPLSVLWDDIEEGRTPDNEPYDDGPPSSGASLAVRFAIGPGETVNVPLLLSWYVPGSRLRSGRGKHDASCTGSGSSGSSGDDAFYRPWYASAFASHAELHRYWSENIELLRSASARFRDTLFDTTLDPAIVEAVAANLSVLKSPTLLRQFDGRLWCWEGCCDTSGCCPGSCTHVWNYAQSLPHLFPDLERSLRETEFRECQTEEGRQTFRAPLPIREAEPDMVPAADGQLGGIIKAYRDWRIGGDTDWIRTLWPRIRQSLDFCIAHWDPAETGLLVEPQHNTYDIEFWGPNSMTSSVYLAALSAAARIGRALAEDTSRFERLLRIGRQRLETELFNGEYFNQRVEWKGLHAGNPTVAQSLVQTNYQTPESIALLEKEGPKYQYGAGCLSDGLIGEWLGFASGLDPIADLEKIRSHLLAVFHNNFRRTLRFHSNPQRPTYAAANEAGLLLCSWPRGGRPTLPFIYSNEIWTGVEYEVAAHLSAVGCVDEALTIVKACRQRYDGTRRNPFDEYECGHWYARSMASYALLQGVTGARYDTVERVFYLAPSIVGDFRCFFACATGYGSVGVKDGTPFLEVRHGTIVVDRFEYTPASQRLPNRGGKSTRP